MQLLVIAMFLVAVVDLADSETDLPTHLVLAKDSVFNHD